MRTREGSRCYSGFDTRLNYADIVVIARIVTPTGFTSGQHGYWNQSNKLYACRWVARIFESAIYAVVKTRQQRDKQLCGESG